MAAHLTQFIQFGDSHTVIPRLVVTNLLHSWKPQRVAGLVLATLNDLGSFDLIYVQHVDSGKM